jgi:hypothetical protein
MKTILLFSILFFSLARADDPIVIHPIVIHPIVIQAPQINASAAVDNRMKLGPLLYIDATGHHFPNLSGSSKLGAWRKSILDRSNTVAPITPALLAEAARFQQAFTSALQASQTSNNQ